MESTYQVNWRGCSGGFMWTPGVFGSSIISGSGGFGVPSMLSVRVFARRAVMASRLGIFLYPTLTFFFSGGVMVSWFSLSSLSEVSASPPSTMLPALLDGAGDVDGEADLVEEAGMTATESFVAIDELDPGPVRRAKAARRGRGAGVGPLLFGFMRAASWLRDGGWRTLFDVESDIVVVQAEGCTAIDHGTFFHSPTPS
jgi:hypothetical protein